MTYEMIVRIQNVYLVYVSAHGQLVCAPVQMHVFGPHDGGGEEKAGDDDDEGSDIRDERRDENNDERLISSTCPMRLAENSSESDTVMSSCK